MLILHKQMLCINYYCYKIRDELEFTSKSAPEIAKIVSSIPFNSRCRVAVVLLLCFRTHTHTNEAVHAIHTM